MGHELQRGAIPVELDRPRILFFPLDATELLIQKYGVNFNSALYSADRAGDGKVTLQLKSLKVMAYFLWAGLQWELGDGEDLSLKQVEAEIPPYRVTKLFEALTMALTGAHATPSLPPGKVSAAAEAGSRRKSRSSISTRSSGSRSGS
jgi:hypothetical protein